VSLTSDVKVVMRMDEIRRKLERLARQHVEVGVIGDAEQAAIATWAEYGTATIPARGFLTRPLNENSEKYTKALGSISDRVARGGDPDQLLGQLGLLGVADVRRWVTSGKATPQNTPATIARKGSSTPLIDSGALVGQHLRHRVVTND